MISKDISKLVFIEIFENNSWGSNESVSGAGSELRNTVNLRYNLSYLIKALNIRSILDVPCGDMNWMSKVNLEGVKYEGWDIVNELIDRNREKMRDRDNFRFYNKDAIKDNLSKADLIISKDFLIHLPISAIWKFLENVVNSGSSYLLISCHRQNSSVNSNIKFGEYRPVNLYKLPFQFPRPIFEIKEESEGAFMVLYKIQHISCVIKNRYRYGK